MSDCIQIVTFNKGFFFAFQSRLELNHWPPLKWDNSTVNYMLWPSDDHEDEDQDFFLYLTFPFADCPVMSFVLIDNLLTTRHPKFKYVWVGRSTTFSLANYFSTNNFPLFLFATLCFFRATFTFTCLKDLKPFFLSSTSCFFPHSPSEE